MPMPKSLRRFLDYRSLGKDLIRLVLACQNYETSLFNGNAHAKPVTLRVREGWINFFPLFNPSLKFKGTISNL